MSRKSMQRASFTLAAIATLALVAAPAGADPAARPPKPYRPVAIVLPAASTDLAFEAFRRELAAVAKGRVYAELARLVEPQEFFWERDFKQAFDARKPAVDNLAAAIRLEHADGAGWKALATFAAEETVELLVSRPGIVCAPAPPSYDGVAFARMLAETYGADLDWTYPRAERTPVRAAPQAGAATVDTLGLHFVRRLGFDSPDGAGAPSRNRWARVVTPAGAVGFVAPGSLMSLDAERLCYGKDAVGRWRITGFIAGAN
jgi:hypothetical protein